MRKLVWPFLFLFFMSLQGAASALYTGWLAFDLPLLFLYAFALLAGEKEGALLGLGIGFVQDAMTVGVFGFHMLSRCALGCALGLMKEKVVKDSAAFHVLMIALCSVALRCAYWWPELLRSGRWSIFFSYAWASAGFILGNMLLVLPVVLLVKKIFLWVKEEEISY